MKKLLICLTVILLLSSCKDRNTRQLQQDSKNSDIKTNEMIGQSHSVQAETEKANINIEACEDCVRIADLIKNKKSYSSKTVRVKGMVTKINPEIMDKNWVHIQDGTEYKEGFDLTVTTLADVQVGDVVIFEGRIELDKDFGYGYFYSILMEDGKTIQ
jgi:hypothetical protein